MKALIISLFCTITLGSYGQNFPEKDWPVNENPSDAGWDPIKMERLNHYIVDSTVVSGLMVIHKGEVVYEFGALSQLSRSASLRKSILAILYGKYVENGTINLDETIGDLAIDDIGGILPIEKQATIKDLLAARSGVYKDREILDPTYLPERGSIVPGTYWYYDSWGFNAAGHIFELKSGNNIYNELESQLAIPLNFQDWDRSAQHKIYNEGVSNFPQYQMWFSTRDMARIGYMMLNDGRWKDTQIISKDWKAEMLKERTSNKEIVKNIPTNTSSHFQLRYGYLWWLFDSENAYQFNNAYLAMGLRGQAIVVYPEIQTVLAFVTSEIYQRSNSGLVQENIFYKVGLMYDPDWKKNYVTSDSFKPIKLTDNQIAPLLGNYKRENRPPVTILKGVEGLTLVFPNGNKQDLIPISENRFVLKDQFIIDGIYKSVEFIKNDEGIVQRVEVRSGEDFSLQKLP